MDIRVGEGTDALNKIVPIDGEGIITLKRLNRVYVEGLTIEELIKVLSKSYSKYVNDVDVSISVLQYRTVTVYIDGEVETPVFIHFYL